MSLILATSIEWISNALLICGSLFCLAGGVGLLRMPEFYTRMHAGSVIDTAGVSLILLALILKASYSLEWLAAVKLVFVGFLIFFSSPTASHALARAAMLRGIKPLLSGDNMEQPTSKLE